MPDTLLISPHLDDAALSCALEIKSGRVAKVVTVFGGVPSTDTPLTDWDRLTRANTASSRVQQRLREDRAAWSSINQAFAHLHHSEHQAHHTDRDELRAAIASHANGVQRVLLPAGIGSHPHHILVRNEAIEALKDTTMELALYGELPYAAFYGWPEDGASALDVSSYWMNELKSVTEDGFGVEYRVTRLSDEERAWKLELLSHYQTQMRAVGGGSLDMFRTTNILEYELHFDVTRRP